MREEASTPAEQVTTRLITLDPPGRALNGVLEALHAACPAGGSTVVGRSETLPPLPGQPPGYTIVDLVTTADQMEAHQPFTEAAGKALSAHKVPYAWRTAAAGNTSAEWRLEGR
jgi:hypothetical protein